jgi:hypothetical protein
MTMGRGRAYCGALDAWKPLVAYFLVVIRRERVVCQPDDTLTIVSFVTLSVMLQWQGVVTVTMQLSA